MLMITPGRATYLIGDQCPWPERRGLTCRRVLADFPEGDIYPFRGVGKYEWVVLVDNDPFSHPDSQWSCVMDRRHLKQIAS
jgi:hypothetical protein